jgi:hypothetical protein
LADGGFATGAFAAGGLVLAGVAEDVPREGVAGTTFGAVVCATISAGNKIKSSFIRQGYQG